MISQQERELREAWASTLRSEQRGYHEGHRVGLIRGLLLGASLAIGLVIVFTAALSWVPDWLFR